MSKVNLGNITLCADDLDTLTLLAECDGSKNRIYIADNEMVETLKKFGFARLASADGNWLAGTPRFKSALKKMKPMLAGD